ncbi:MAG: toll/interleukin-1 receptor domain-containing protein [Candidatus Aminicenantes bacterium]|nr:MAG: toll/interleukin-1 receptor domain-containing protein [Candidatus Aminicenantes bacterium]
MKDIEYDAFISYSHKDKEFAQKLLTKLEEKGLRIAIDFRDFKVGTPILVELERLVRSSKYIILILSQDWIESQWTNIEAMFLQMQDLTGMKRKIIPLMYKKCELPHRLSTYTYADFTGDFDSAFNKLIFSLGIDPEVAKAEKYSSDYGGDSITLREVLELNWQILKLITENISSTSRGTAKVFHDFGITMDHRLCFVLMPFSTNWSRKFFERHIELPCRELSLNAIRADDIYGVEGIMQDIWIHINKARIIIADLTGRNPNVFYEVGLAHAIGKDVILITQTMDDVPFDLRSLRCIVYSLELDCPEKFEEMLKNTINAVLRVDNT